MMMEIEQHLRRTGMPPSLFGRVAINDPRLVYDLRNGRSLRAKSIERIKAVIAAHNVSQHQRSMPGEWSDDECWKLLALIADGYSQKEAAHAMGRTRQAVNARLFKLIDEQLPARPDKQRAARSAAQILAAAGRTARPEN